MWRPLDGRARVVSNSPARRPWRHWCEISVQVVLILFAIFTICDKGRHESNYAAMAAGLAALLLAVTGAPLDPRRLDRLFIIGLLFFLVLNLLAAGLADPIPGRGGFAYYRLHVHGVAAALAAGLGLRDRTAVGRVLFALMLAAGIWYLGEAVTLPWRERAFVAGRFQGTRGHPMIPALELAILLPLYVGCTLALVKRRTALASLGGTLLTGSLLYLTKGRGALLVTAGATVPATTLLQRRLGSVRLRAALVCLWLFLAVPAVGTVWWYSADPARRSPATIQARLRAQKICLQIMTRGPWYRWLIGHGRSSRLFFAAANHYQTDSPVALGEDMLHSHNVLSQTLIETGVPGVAALCMIWCAAAWAAFSAWRRKDQPAAEIAGVFLVSLLSIAALCQVEYPLWETSGRLCWLLVGLAYAYGTAPATAEAAGPHAADTSVASAAAPHSQSGNVPITSRGES